MRKDFNGSFSSLFPFEQRGGREADGVWPFAVHVFVVYVFTANLCL